MRETQGEKRGKRKRIEREKREREQEGKKKKNLENKHSKQILPKVTLLCLERKRD